MALLLKKLGELVSCFYSAEQVWKVRRKTLWPLCFTVYSAFYSVGRCVARLFGPHVDEKKRHLWSDFVCLWRLGAPERDLPHRSLQRWLSKNIKKELVMVRDHHKALSCSLAYLALMRVFV